MRDLLALNPDCCVASPAVPPEFQCFLPELEQEYCKLVQRHNSQLTKNKRILSLAEPKWCPVKIHQPCVCPEVAPRKVEIFRDKPTYTRTDQLSYPKPRQLIDLKQHPTYSSFHFARKQLINRTLRKSMLSMYSRLANTVLPREPEKPKRFDKTGWEDHLKRVDNVLSKPKPDLCKKSAKQGGTKGKGKPKGKPKPKPIPIPMSLRRSTRASSMTQSGMSGDMRRMKRLAKPKTYEDTTAPPWQLTNSMRTYVPSKRILEMSKPRRVDTTRHIKPADEPLVTPEALRYRATERIRDLARPPAVYHKPEKKETPFVTSRRALKAKPTQRIIELAEPRDYMDMNVRLHPYKVSQNALRAKLTPRLRELAKPKEYAK